MDQQIAVAIAVIFGAGIGSQLIARAVRIPSVLLLLPVGILVGPGLNLLDPTVLFADALYPVIAIAVGLILFEGGVGLRLSGAGIVRRPVMGLVTIGVVVTLAIGGSAATLLLGVPADVGFLIGTILVVSGPTVVLPLLEVVRLREPVGSILRWECIAIDPIGAVLAVAVFNAIIDSHAGFNPLATLAASAAVGIATGTVAGFGLALLLRYHLIPDRLQSATTLALVIGCFVLANTLSVEAGLFATIVMGIVLANQRLAPTSHIANFGEDLGVLILGGLYIILGATASLTEMRAVLVPAVGLLIILLAVRPLAVWISTIGAGLATTERWYLSLIVPRGIIAASVSTLFAAALRDQGVNGATKLAPVAFVVILGSVVVASALARPAARWLRVAAPTPRGILLAGSETWMIDAGKVLARNGVPVLIADSDAKGTAASAGLLTFTDSLDSATLPEALDAVGVGVAVVGSNDGVADTFLVDQLSQRLGGQNVYLVDTPQARREISERRYWGRPVFSGLGDRDWGWEWEIVELEGSNRPISPPNDSNGIDDESVIGLFAIKASGPPSVLTDGRLPSNGQIIAARAVRR